MSKLVLAAAAIASLSFAGQALAEQADQAQTRAVSTASVNFTDQAAVQGFYGRLRSAAKEVCDSGSIHPTLIRKDHACVRAIMSQAVRKMDRPMLTALYRANNPGAENVGYATGF